MKTAVIGSLMLALFLTSCGKSAPTGNEQQSPGQIDSVRKRFVISQFIMRIEGIRDSVTEAKIDLPLISDLQTAAKQGTASTILAKIEKKRTVLEDAMRKEQAAAEETLAVPIPVGISESEVSLLVTVRESLTDSHRQEAAAYRSLLKANQSNLASMLQGFFDHSRLMNDAAAKASEAERKAQQQ